MYPQNLHTHSRFSDGKNTCEELVEEALEKGLTSLGFSDHAPFSSYACNMKEEVVPLYRREISRLQEKYSDKIELFCGAEIDAQSTFDCANYDYVIGSVHGVEVNGEFVNLDVKTPEQLEETAKKHFQGDGNLLAKHYFLAMEGYLSHPKVDIIGHFDIIAKHAEKTAIVNQDDPRYRAYALETLVALVEKIPVFELNCGGIARGYRSTPYLHPFLLKELKARGGKVILSSDCHRKENLGAHFEEAEKYLISLGFREVVVWTREGFAPYLLEK